MSTRRSLAFAFIDRYASLAINIGSSMVVARLLSPADIGIFSISMVIVQVTSTVRDLGTGQFLVQAKNLSAEHLKAVWTVQLLLGISLAAVLAAASQPAALIYRDAQVGNILLVLCVNFLLNPLGSVTYAWLSRELRFDALAVIRFASTMATAITSIFLAWRGFGAISLAIGSVAGTLFSAGVSMFYRPRDLAWGIGLQECRTVLSFGWRVTVTAIVNTLGKGSPEFILAKVEGFAAAGLLSRANGLVQIFYRLVLDAVHGVAFALFSREAREGKPSSESLARATSYMCALGWSFAGLVACTAHPLVRLMYGDQWDMSVQPVRILSLAIAFGVPTSLGYAFLHSQGHAGAGARLTLKISLVTIAGVLLTVRFGMIAVCWSVALSTLIATVLWARELSKLSTINWKDWSEPLLKSLAVAAGATTGPAIVLAWLGAQPDRSLLAATCASVGAACGFAATAYLVKHPLTQELDRLVGMLLRRRSS